MDRVLHAERLDERSKRRHRLRIETLPDGAMISMPDQPQSILAVQGERLLPWTPGGYRGAQVRPHRIIVDVLTPPSILAVLAQGYCPHWHPSAFT